MSLTLSAEDLDAIAARCAAKVAEYRVSYPELVTRRQAMSMLACESDSALDRALQELRVRPVLQGKYRRLDIIGAVAGRAAYPFKKKSPSKKNDA